MNSIIRVFTDMKQPFTNNCMSVRRKDELLTRFPCDEEQETLVA